MRYVEAVITIQKSHNHEKQPEKESQIRELKSICEELSRNISDNATIVDSKEKSVLEGLNEMASKKSVAISYVVGVIGIIVALVQFFI